MGYGLQINLTQYNRNQTDPEWPVKTPVIIHFEDNTNKTVWLWCNSTEITSYGISSFLKLPVKLEIDQLIGILYFDPEKAEISLAGSSTSTTPTHPLSSTTPDVISSDTSSTDPSTIPNTGTPWIPIGVLLVGILTIVLFFKILGMFRRF